VLSLAVLSLAVLSLAVLQLAELWLAVRALASVQFDASTTLWYFLYIICDALRYSSYSNEKFSQLMKYYDQGVQSRLISMIVVTVFCHQSARVLQMSNACRLGAEIIWIIQITLDCTAGCLGVENWYHI